MNKTLIFGHRDIEIVIVDLQYRVNMILVVNRVRSCWCHRKSERCKCACPYASIGEQPSSEYVTFISSQSKGLGHAGVIEKVSIVTVPVPMPPLVSSTRVNMTLLVVVSQKGWVMLVSSKK